MLEKTVTDASIKTTQAVEKGVESLVKKAWSIMDAASEKKRPSEFLSEKGIYAIQGKE